MIKYIALSGSEEICISELEKVVGTPIDTFRTYSNSSTLCLLSGLSYPQTRLDIIRKKVMDNKDLIKKNLSVPSQQKMKNDINFLDEISKPEKAANSSVNSNSIRDKMSKYL